MGGTTSKAAARITYELVAGNDKDHVSLSEDEKVSETLFL